MKNAILVHGKPTRKRYEDPSEPRPHVANWFPWISRELENRGVEVAIPALPKPYFPVYIDWKVCFEAYPVNSSTALVGHSAGAEFILRWLSENSAAVAERVVLVAPYKDFEGKYGDFSDYKLDSNLIDRVGKLSILHSTDDDEPIHKRAHELKSSLCGALLIELSGYGHFRIGHNMQSEALPPLIAELQK